MFCSGSVPSGFGHRYPERFVSAPVDNPYRLLPSVEEVLQQHGGQVEAAVGRDLAVRFARTAIDELRGRVVSENLTAEQLERELATGCLARDLFERVQRELRRGVRRAINATGVVLHTGLGRAVVDPEAARRMAEVASSYCVLEVDRDTGRRNRRDDRLSELLARATGAEAGIAVNNNAAAVFLCLSTFAQKRETIVSRGELVEIGGSFRMPDVMERAGTRLVEVGTTNRTRVADYAGALTSETGLLLKVHRSNFAVAGFVEEVSAKELGALGTESGHVTAFDLGSGLLETDEPLGPAFRDETLVRTAVESGVSVVTFSGDKLLGGPQAGLVVGTALAVSAMRDNPVYRAMRLDKVALAGLEATLERYVHGTAHELPVQRMLRATAAELAPRAARLAQELSELPGVTARDADADSEPGSGSAPGTKIPTRAVRVELAGRSTDALADALRAGDPPIFTRIHEQAVWLDPRTLLEGDDEQVVGAFRALAGPEHD